MPRATLLIAATVAVSGCLPSLGPDVYSREEARAVKTHYMGKVVMVREVPISGRSSPVGTYGGGYIGAEVAEKRMDVHDFHATILHLLGLDHEQLTYHYSGRDFRLTDVAGRVVDDIVS